MTVQSIIMSLILIEGVKVYGKFKYWQGRNDGLFGSEIKKWRER